MSNLKKIRVQHVDRDAKGVEIKTDVDVITDADCITMDDGDLRSGVKKMIDDRIGEVIDGAPEELDTLKEIATELEKNQSGVSTILNKMNDKLEAKDLEGYAKTTEVDKKLKSKVSVVNGKGLSSNDYTNTDKAKVDALVSLSADKKLVYKQKRNTDFNNITEAGFYTVQTKNNAPHNQYDYWSLIVLNSTSVDSGTYIQQIAINEKVEDRAIYVRKKSHNWSSWIKLEAAPDLSNLVTKVDGKGLSTNDFTNEYKEDINRTAAMVEIAANQVLANSEAIGELKEMSSALVYKTDIVDFKRCIVISETNYAALSDAEKNRADTLYFLI